MTTSYIPSEVSFYWVELMIMLAQKYSIRTFHPENNKEIPCYYTRSEMKIITEEKEELNSVFEYELKDEKIVRTINNNPYITVYSCTRTYDMNKLLKNDFFISVCNKIEGLEKSHELALIAINKIEKQLEDL